MNRKPRSLSSLSLFVGIWAGLTLLAGLGVFGLFYWAMVPGAEVAGPATAPPAVASDAPADAPTDAPVAGQPDQPAPCDYPPEPASGFGYGIQTHSLVPGVDPTEGIDIVRYKLNLQWIKLQVRWYVLEPQPGQIDWTVLDNAMSVACAKGVRVMLSVVAAPDWTRASPLPAPQGQEAPPDDYQALGDFLVKIVDRYPGRVQAIEVWNEANLEREWNTADGVNAGEFAKLMQVAYVAIKSRDPNITVISGAPAPTGVNCRGSFPECPAEGRVIVVDDLTFMQQFIAAGGLNFTDCVGAHSNGTNLPPTADGANPPGDGSGYDFKGPWSNPHYSWALRSQIEAYARLLPQGKRQCVTEFGYASPLEGKFPPGYEFAADVSEQQQAEYLTQAIDWMRDSGYVQLAFIFNLNYAPLGGDPAEDDNTIFSLVSRQGVPRPAFDAIALMPKP